MAALIGFVKFARKNLRSKVACLGLQLHQKRLHHIYFLLNWGMFSEKLFHRTPPADCFCKDCFYVLLLCRTVNKSTMEKCDALLDLVPFVQFKKGEKHPWRSVSRFLNCTNGTKSRNPSQMSCVVASLCSGNHYYIASFRRIGTYVQAQAHILLLVYRKFR